MALYERSAVLWAVCDDLMDSIQDRDHRISLQVLRRVLLPTRKIADKVPQSVVPCNDRRRGQLSVSVQVSQSPGYAGELQAWTYEVFIPPVHGQVAESNGHSSHHFVHIGAQQLHQDGQPFLFSHRGPDVAGPLQTQRI